MSKTANPDTVATTFLTRLYEDCGELLLSSWIPKASTRPSRPPKLASKFGGSTPWISDEWKWPYCGTCTRGVMTFLCQINLADLPGQLKARIDLNSGLFQSFVCIYCVGNIAPLDRFGMVSFYGEPNIEAFEDWFTGVRIVPQEDIEPHSLGYLSAVASRDIDAAALPDQLQKFRQAIWQPSSTMPQTRKYPQFEIFNERFVSTDWMKNESLEIPCYGELVDKNDTIEKLGLTHSDVLLSMEVIGEQNLYNPYNNNPYEGHRTKRITVGDKITLGDKTMDIGLPYSGLKAGGWVDWQHQYRENLLEYPICPYCPHGPRMDVVFLLIELNPELFTQFGRWVGGYVTLCPTCRKPALKWYYRRGQD